MIATLYGPYDPVLDRRDYSLPSSTFVSYAVRMFEIEDFAECGVGGELLFPGALVLVRHGDIVCADCAHRLQLIPDLLYH